MLIVDCLLSSPLLAVGGYDVCVCAADKKRAYELGAWDEPNATNQLSGLAPAAESRSRERWRGKVKPANDVWDRDEVDGDLHYNEMDICKDSLFPATYTR